MGDRKLTPGMPVVDAADSAIRGTVVLGELGVLYVCRAESLEIVGPVDSDQAFDWQQDAEAALQLCRDIAGTF